MKLNTRVLALFTSFENRKICKEIFRVSSCVIYTIIRNYVFIDYLGSEKSKLIDLRLGVAGSYKHLGKNMTTYWDSEFHICYWICCLVRDSWRTMDLLSYSNFLIGYLNTILIKDSLFLIVLKSIKKTSIWGKRQSWCRSKSQFKQIHDMFYHYSFHLKYSDKLVRRFKFSFFLNRSRL